MSNTPSDINSNEITPDKPNTTTNQYALLFDPDEDDATNVKVDETNVTFRDFLGSNPPFRNLDSREFLPKPILPTIPTPPPPPCIGAECPIQQTTYTMPTTNSTTAYPELKDKIRSSPKITSTNKKPTLTSIFEAKNILGTALQTYHCTLPGAGIDGHAWLVDGLTVWTNRSGETKFPTNPTPPTRPTTYDNPSIARYNDEFESYKVYKFLNTQILDLFEHWFGIDVFSASNDLDDHRPNTLTARVAIDKLEKTYITPALKREEYQALRRTFEAITYSPSAYPLPISYFRAFIKCQLKAANLGRNISDQDVTDKAYLQLEEFYGEPLHATCEKWNATAPANQTLTEFTDHFQPFMLRYKPAMPPTGSANHIQAVGEIRDDVNILDDNQVGITNELAAMKTQFAALANAVNTRSTVPPPETSTIQARIDAGIKAELARLNLPRRRRPGGEEEPPPFTWLKDQPWRAKKTTDTVTVDGKQYWWCAHHRVQDRYDGLYVSHKECDHAEWKKKKNRLNAGTN